MRQTSFHDRDSIGKRPESFGSGSSGLAGGLALPGLGVVCGETSKEKRAAPPYADPLSGDASFALPTIHYELTTHKYALSASGCSPRGALRSLCLPPALPLAS